MRPDVDIYRNKIAEPTTDIGSDLARHPTDTDRDVWLSRETRLKRHPHIPKEKGDPNGSPFL